MLIAESAHINYQNQLRSQTDCLRFLPTANEYFVQFFENLSIFNTEMNLVSVVGNRGLAEKCNVSQRLTIFTENQ